MRTGAALAPSALLDELVVYPAGPLDREAIEAFVAGLSPASRYWRFLHALRQLPAELMDSWLRFEPSVRATMLASRVDSPGELIGMAQYEASPRPADCEVAVVVADASPRRGVASLLLRELARVARLGGLRTASAEILTDNHAAIELARRHQCSISLVPGAPQLTRVSVPLDQVVRPVFALPTAGRTAMNRELGKAA